MTIRATPRQRSNETTGRAEARASAATNPKDSYCDGIATTEAAAYSVAVSCTIPARTMRSRNPSRAISVSMALRSSPSPTRRSDQPGKRGATSAKARTSSEKFFSGRNRPTASRIGGDAGGVRAAAEKTSTSTGLGTTCTQSRADGSSPTRKSEGTVFATASRPAAAARRRCIGRVW